MTRLRSGRLSYVEREILLERIGEEAEKRYRQNLTNTGYKGYWFMDAFKFIPDVYNFENYYELDTGNTELNKILGYLEYGTGLYGKRKRMIQSKKISKKTGQKLLLKFEYEGNWIFKRKVKGIKPGFMFTKAVESVRNEWETLIRRFRLEEGI